MGILRSLRQWFCAHVSEEPVNSIDREGYEGHPTNQVTAGSDMMQTSSSSQGTSIFYLPEELIFSIISKLKLKDVVNFSMVTKQWLQIPCCLESIVFDHMIKKDDRDEAAFVKGVDQFLQHYMKLRNKLEESSRLALPVSLQSFVIVFCLTKNYTTEINTWIAIAFRIGARSLTLNFKPQCEPFHYRPDNDKYTFPWKMLDQYPCLLETLYLRSCIFRCRLTSKWITLEILDLWDIRLINYDLDRIDHCFPNLRKLVFVLCRLPAKLTFGSGSLTTLVVNLCPGQKEIVVLDTCALMKFFYSGELVRFNLSRAPKLTNVIFAFDDPNVDYYVFQNLRPDFPKMRTLTIFRDGEFLRQPLCPRGQVSLFRQLEELKLYHHPACGFSLETMTQVLKACPVLRKLDIITPCTLDTGNGIKSHVPYLHNCLTFIKISGFCGSWGNVELAKFLVQVSEALDHVVVQREAYVNYYLFSEHSETWCGELEQESVKDMLLNLTRSKQFTFL